MMSTWRLSPRLYHLSYKTICRRITISGITTSNRQRVVPATHMWRDVCIRRCRPGGFSLWRLVPMKSRWETLRWDQGETFHQLPPYNHHHLHRHHIERFHKDPDCLGELERSSKSNGINELDDKLSRPVTPRCTNHLSGPVSPRQRSTLPRSHRPADRRPPDWRGGCPLSPGQDRVDGIISRRRRWRTGGQRSTVSGPAKGPFQLT